MLDQAAVERGAGFPDHPHRGQSTVTYVLGGAMQHEDFLGNAGRLETGDVQWMTAGRGIVHSEMPLYDETSSDTAEALQLWIDLPAARKMGAPSYQERKAAEIATARPADGVAITVVSGESHGVAGFVRPESPCWFLDVRLAPGRTVWQPVPAGWTAFAYVLAGHLQVGAGAEAAPVGRHHTVTLSSEPAQNGVQLSAPDGADGETRFVLVAGEPLDQPVVQYGPFVVNTQRQAMEAVADYQMGRNGFERAPEWKSKIGSAMRR